MRRFGGTLLLMIAMVTVSANLRPAISSVPPLLDAIRVSLGLSHAAAGLITTIPVLLMGIVPAFAAMLAARQGSERLVLAALVLVGLGIAARLVELPAVLYASSALCGAGIAAAQTLLPDIAKRRFGGAAALVMSIQATAMTAGAGLAAVVTPALSPSWSVALAWWAAPALAGAVLWWLVAGTARGEGGGPGHRFGFPLRSATAWRITLFAAMSSAMFYTTLTWIPPTYAEAGWSSGETGGLLLVMSVAGMAASLGVTWFARHAGDRRWQLVGSVALAAIGCAGLGLAPLAAPWTWMTCIGLSTGAMFPLSLMLPVDYEDRPEALRRLSAMSLTGGYVLAAAGPVLFGWLREGTGFYAWSYLILGGWAAATCVLALGFRPRKRVL
jgi:CP family cyanate transporter-like MFS transporter